MRPERLELEGFTAFRQPTVVDFAGAELFALAGPTGAGKSSVIDAMCFALYGSIPRYEDLRLVAPLVSVGRAEARVRLDFVVGRERYTAVRVVRRTPKGATTKEARLERGDEVLAGDAAALTQGVERLLGVGFDEFCKCVVLPQGAFARFLHDKPKDRQDLLVGLLDLGLYGRVRDLAVQRQRSAEGRVAALAEQLSGELAAVSAAAVAAARARVDALAQVAERVRAVEPLTRDAERSREAAEREAVEAEGEARRLAAIAVPADVPQLARTLADAAEAVRAAERAEAVAGAAIEEAEKALAGLGDRAALARAVAAHDELASLVVAREPLVAASSRAAAEAEGMRLRAVAAKQARDEAEVHLEAVRQANRAVALHRELAPGAPCPVCRQVVTAVPPIDVPEAFDAAKAAFDAAASGWAVADQTARTTAQRAERAEAALSAHDDRIAQVTAGLAGVPARPELVDALEAIGAAEAGVAAARAAEARARSQHARARADHEAARQGERRGWRALDAARDSVASLQPPIPARSDLAADWQLLVAWSASQVPAEQDRAAAAGRRARAAAESAAQLVAQLGGELAEAGVAMRPGLPPGEAVAAAHASAVHDADRQAEALERSERVRAELAASEEAATVARNLALHLRADRFEKWLLDDAVEDLVEGATGTLHELSGGAYSLCLDDRRDFAVVDHRNADEQRPVRTLSGGETFLASLALALALAERVAQRSDGSGARLESLFLDEGFGTLDPETLDTVASAIEHLQAGGRMVGIVTHVQELAERVPVRFDVRRQPGGSTIERVAG